METIFTVTCFILLLCILGFCIYGYLKTNRIIREQDIAHKKALAEAGNAITDTLKIVFENLKKNSSDHNKINTKITEQNSRIHRLEQHINRKNQPAENNTEYIEEDTRILRKKQKE